MFLTLSTGFQTHDFYQVTSSHPHDIEDMKVHTETVYKNGRVWIVQIKENAPLSIKKHLRPLSGGEKSYIFNSPVASEKKFKKKDSIKGLVENIDIEAIKEDVYELASLESRAAGTAGNQQAVQLVFDRLTEYGYEVKKICYSSDVCSVVADKRGTHASQEVLLVMAHIDSVGYAFAGADDNASGTAVLLEMARVLQYQKTRKTIRFFISNGEERGLLGASHYVRLLSGQNKLSEISIVINMDMVGYNSNGIVELETNPEFEELAQWYAGIAIRYTKLTPKISLGAWGSDHIPFLRRGIPSMLIIENWDTKSPCYHQECDRPETLNFAYAAEIGKMNLAAIMNKDLF